MQRFRRHCSARLTPCGPLPPSGVLPHPDGMGEKTATATTFLDLTLELTRELHAGDHGIVDEAGQVVEVDAADEADLVQTVAAIG